MTSKTICVALLAALYLCAGVSTSLAEGAVDGGGETIYGVEIIVFRNADQSRTTPEIARPARPDIAAMLEEDLPTLGVSSSAAEQALQEITVLNSSQLALAGVRQRLDSLGAYQVLAHRAWLQSAPDVSVDSAVSLAQLGIDPVVLTGDIRLYQRRYLHLSVDIALGGSSAMQARAAEKREDAISASRRVRLEDLIYFDHPQFGVIARVSRPESPEK